MAALSIPLRAHKMDQETLGSVVLLAIVTLISFIQNGEAEIRVHGRGEQITSGL